MTVPPSALATQRSSPLEPERAEGDPACRRGKCCLRSAGHARPAARRGRWMSSQSMSLVSRCAAAAGFCSDITYALDVRPPALADEGDLVAGAAPGDAAVVRGEAGDVAAGSFLAAPPSRGMMNSSLAKEPSMRA